MGINSVDYHRQTIVDRADDYPGRALEYYGSRGETPLRWGGSGAARLGLEGTVTDAQYVALFAADGACDPTSSVRLVGTRRPGMELVVSAHKSVAELGVIGQADAMHSILDAERDATLSWVDDLTRWRGGRRGRQQHRTETGGLVYAHTRHATSRAGDPCPHDHVLLVNLVEMADAAAGWKAADTALWRDELHAATLVGRMAAARTAVELGYGIEADRGPSGRLRHWRIAGIPDAVLEAHSKRSGEIDLYMESRGISSARARAVAARQTRKAKRREPVGELVGRWRRELGDAGHDPMALAESVAAAGRRAGRPPGPLTSAELARLVAEVVKPDGELARRKVFGRAEVIVAVAPRLFGRPMSELARAVEAVLADREAIPLVGVAAARDRCYTLAHVVVTEHAIADMVAVGTAVNGAGMLTEPMIEGAVAQVERRLGRPLTDGQVAAVRGICTEGRHVSLVVGVAGSGKTTALAAVADSYRTAGYQVIGTATAGQAARTLGRQADIPARTLTSLRWRLHRGQLQLTDKTLVVLDEAGMTDDPDVLYVLSAASIAQAKVVLVGDNCQLGPVGPGGALGALVERQRGLVHLLDENVRQVDPGERQALAELRAGDIATAVDWYAKHDRIRVSADRDEAIAATVEGWAADSAHGRDAVMVAWRRSSVHDLNQHGRQAWLALGQLSGPELVGPGGRRYRAGDRIVTLAPAPDGSLVTSQHGTVTMVNPQCGALIACMDDGRLHRLEGDQLAADRLDYAYALTVHRCQGLTTETCHHLADGGGRELAYVAMSRARSTTIVHTVADNLDQAVEDVSQQWGQARRPRWAIDQGRPDPDGRARSSQPVRLVSEKTARRLSQLIERTRLTAERDALAAAIQHDPSRNVDRNKDQHWQAQSQLAALRQGQYHGDDRQLADVSQRLVHATDQRDSVAYRRSWPGRSRRELRRLNRKLDGWTNAVRQAQDDWQRLTQPETEKVTAVLEQLQQEEQQLREQHADLVAWWDQHPEARGRLAMLDQRLHQLDNPETANSTRAAPKQPPNPTRPLSHGAEHEPSGRYLGYGLGS